MLPRSSERIRPAAVAGRFYPGGSEALERVVDDLLTGQPLADEPAPKALVVPHAGYPFSAPIAASAYACWRPLRGQVRRVILLGPSHYVAFAGLAASSATAFATPLGLVPVAQECLAEALADQRVMVLDKAHAHEHALEVQLPFLQRVLGAFRLVPLLAGETDPEKVGDLLDALWGGPETRIVVSSDLSHYLDSPAARMVDQATARAIEALAPDQIRRDQACGRVPLLGLLYAARRHGLHARTLDLRNSGDTAGPRDRVVGYGAFSFG